MRRSPINGKPIDVVNARETVQLLGKNKAGTWYLITNLRGVTGWVSAILLKVDPQIAASLPVQPANVLTATSTPPPGGSLATPTPGQPINTP